jgi:mannose-1-phosphate guanylyltransferase
MKIKPVILCGGAGTRLWPKSKKNLAKQFIDFGGWTLFQRTLERIKKPMFDYPIISTNLSYLKLVQKHLQKSKIYNYKIILEPFKKNTAAAILSSTLLEEISFDQPMIFFPADHLIEKINQFNKAISYNEKYLDEDNIFIFGIKPYFPSSQYGYFLTKKTSKGINKVSKFIEKPKAIDARKIIKNKAYWNSGILFARKISIISNFRKYQRKTLNLCIEAVSNSKISKNVSF